MATKPMPRIRAGASGSPVTPISTGKKPNLEKSAKIVTVRRNRNSDSSIDFNKDSMDPVFKSRTSLNDNHEATTTAVAEPTCFGTKSKPENHISDQTHGPPKELKLTLENCNKMSLTEEATNLMQNSMVDVQKCSDGNSEISRLKELMMLQVSLISRQQDLLKLRDKEIMHLKANNQSFKCRLERMERRISLSKRNWKESEPPSTHSQPNHDGKRKRPDPDHKNEVKAKEIQPPTAPIPPAQTPAPTNQQVDSVNPVVNKPINVCSTPTKTTPKEENTSFTANTSEPSHNSSCLSNISPIKTPDVSCLPVPISFIERFQSQLFTHTSPNSPPDVGIKICDQCPHCVALASEIKYLLSIASNAGIGNSFLNKSSSNEVMLKINAVCKTEAGEENNKVTVPPILLTKHCYYKRLSPYQCNSPWRIEWDIYRDDGSMLNIPTWRENKILPLEGSSEDNPVELTDDDCYNKRHNKFEIAEKRRKRWDIQRIREFRYNEKLRQKIVKQNGNKDDPVESFTPFLFEIDALAVENSLPVNVFGHCLPQLSVQEFSLR